MRDLIRDWQRWSAAERTLALLILAALATLPPSLALGIH